MCIHIEVSCNINKWIYEHRKDLKMLVCIHIKKISGKLYQVSFQTIILSNSVYTFLYRMIKLNVPRSRDWH